MNLKKNTYYVWFSLDKVTTNQQLFCFHLLIISFYTYINSGFTCEEVTILRHNVFTVAKSAQGFMILQ